MDESRFICWTKKEESWASVSHLSPCGLISPIPVAPYPAKRRSENDNSPNRLAGATEGASTDPSQSSSLFSNLAKRRRTDVAVSGSALELALIERNREPFS